MDLSIIIVNWNVEKLLKNTLAAIYRQPPTAAFEVFVIDNASQDNSVLMVQSEFPQVKLIKNAKNLGFGTANNQGLKLARGQVVLCLNPDTEVSPGALDFIFKKFQENPKLGALGVKLLNTDGSLQLSCKSFPDLDTILWNALSLDVLFPRSKIFGKYNMTWFKHDQEMEVDQPMGAALAVRKTVLEQVGMFDEQYFMYFEEVDWCYRIKKAGWQIIFFPQVTITHHWAQSTKQALFNMNQEWYRSFYKYLKKNRGYPGWLIVLALSSMIWLKLLLVLIIIIIILKALGWLGSLFK